MYYLYIVRCADKTLYTGIAQDVKKRVAEHNMSDVGAKYTRARRPVKLVYTRRFRSRSTASRAEARVKQLSRPAKLAMIKIAKRRSLQ
ncbi:GIY-YIG nuclease family protein [Patescibacteria group bacterium]|nr:GIY-YIG nuclease family protein [Patescibacteria group bacterium]